MAGLLLAVALAGPLVAACGSDDPGTAFELPFACGTTWTALTYVTGETVDATGTVLEAWEHANAIDFGQRGVEGEPVLASAPGFARLSDPDQGQVTVVHADGWATRYQHMVGITVDGTGRFVEQGDVLGVVDNAGTSTGSHLHYVQLLNGIPQPARFRSGAFTWGPPGDAIYGDMHLFGEQRSTNSLTSGNCPEGEAG